MTVTPSPSNDAPVSRVHYHRDTDDRGPFWVAVCPCLWASREFDGPDGGVTAEYAKALHDQDHEDEMEAAS